MVRPNPEKWNQSIDELRRLGVEAEHPRSRERFQALYMIGSRLKNAYQWAQEIKRQARTVLKWIHLYNEQGPAGVHYQSSGGCSAQLNELEKAVIVQTVTRSEPVAHELPGHGWTLKKLCQWVASQLGKKVSRTNLRTILKAAGLSWKQCKKIFGKGDPAKRKAFVEQFQALYERMCRAEIRILYIDEAHFHQDLALGYTWSPIGDPTWRKSTCPSLSARLNWYGAYDFSEGRCLLWHNEACNNQHTCDFLDQVVTWLKSSSLDSHLPVIIIWDNAPWHCHHSVQEKARRLGFQLIPLPAYSPDLNPIEGLWHWMREEVTKLFCHPSLYALHRSCLDFLQRINQDPDALISRLWPKFDLDPNRENFAFST